MNRTLLVAMLKTHEGCGPVKNGRFMPYKCPAGFITIGWGHNLDANGLTREQAERLLSDDIDWTIRDLVVKFPWFETLDPIRQAVLIDMGFNMGVPGLAAFKNTLRAVQAGDYGAAAVGMLESRWAEQVGARARRLSEMMRTGLWQQ